MSPMCSKGACASPATLCESRRSSSGPPTAHTCGRRTYDRQMSDIFQVQDEIAAAVVEELKIKLLGAAPIAKTTDPKAYALFLRARELARLLTEASLEQAIPLYQQA